MILDPLYIITILSAGTAAVVGFFSIRNEIKKGREENQQKIAAQIQSESTGVKDFIDARLNIVDAKFDTVKTRLDQGAEDIKDVKADFKQMNTDFKDVMKKVERNTFILETTMPEWKTLRQDFYNFKEAIDRKITGDGNIVRNKGAIGNNDI